MIAHVFVFMDSEILVYQNYFSCVKKKSWVCIYISLEWACIWMTNIWTSLQVIATGVYPKIIFGYFCKSLCINLGGTVFLFNWHACKIFITLGTGQLRINPNNKGYLSKATHTPAWLLDQHKNMIGSAAYDIIETS